MLTFESESHKYFWNGLEVPSVTTILAKGAKFPPNAAMLRGTQMHLEQEQHELAVDQYSVTRYFGLANTLVEQRVAYIRKGIPLYAGTVDLVGTTPTGERVIVDHKSGRQYQNGFWKYNCQIAAYCLMFNCLKGYIHYMDATPHWLYEVPNIQEWQDEFLKLLFEFRQLNPHDFFEGELSWWTH